MYLFLVGGRQEVGNRHTTIAKNFLKQISIVPKQVILTTNMEEHGPGFQQTSFKSQF